MKVLSVKDHGVFRGHREWTVRVEDDEGEVIQCAVRDAQTSSAAERQGIEMAKNRRKFTPEEKEALRRSNDGLRRGLL